MKTKASKKTAANLPPVKLETAEKTLRDIARRNGEIIRKRRSKILKERFGSGYALIDAITNCYVSGTCTEQDGCDWGLETIAKYYKDDDDNTPWQRIVIASVLADKVED